ncbi:MULTISPECIES: ABC transporter ATP-binding protein, partial [unclassified Frankia]|uniref:metal ABC transporter ATP-binding protein n=1 Tax=unclassified Frankia TaxID=2632575 RepID=UPI002AD55A61
MTEAMRGLSGGTYSTPDAPVKTAGERPASKAAERLIEVDVRSRPAGIPGASGASERPETPETAGPAVVFDRATVAYGRTPVLTTVHGTVETGHAVAVIGPNGAGKSTLIKAILGLAPVTGGSVTVFGQQPARARRRIAYVPQTETLDAKVRVTVTQIVLMGRYRWIGWVRRPTFTDRAAAARALATVGLADHARDCFGTLSSAQRQRVMLARAIAQQPRLLLLDEPFTEVDVLCQAALLSTLATMRASGTSVVISTRDLALAHLTCDDVFLLNDPQVTFGPTASTLTHYRLTAAFGGSEMAPLQEATIAA